MRRLIDFYFFTMKGNLRQFAKAKVSEVFDLEGVWEIGIEVGGGIWSRKFPTKSMAEIHREAIVEAISQCKQLLGRM